MARSHTHKQVHRCPSGGMRNEPSAIPTAATPLHDLAGKLAAGKYKNVVVLCGAGISTASGIPDFRSAAGLYNQLQDFKLDKPTDMFDIDFFRKDPKPFFTLAKRLYPGSYLPNAAHYFLRLLHANGSLLRVYTQNIDGLERLSGINSNILIESHGTFASAHCTVCHKEINPAAVKEAIFGDVIPHCTNQKCNGVVKPDITFFGEALPRKFQKTIAGDLKKCDLLIVMGTSLKAQPFASLPGKVGKNVPRLLINNEKVGPFVSLHGHYLPPPSGGIMEGASGSTPEDLLTQMVAGLSLKNAAAGSGADRVTCAVPEEGVKALPHSAENVPRVDVTRVGPADNGRDLALLGDITDSVHLLAVMAGWHQPFAHIIAQGIAAA